jgi:uncharacterized membrane protein
MALVAVSPVHIIHAQSARPRTLWILMILLSSGALLKAARLNRKRDWILYGIALTLSLYTFLFSVLVAVAHGVYIFLREPFCKPRMLIRYLCTAGFVILSFAPWIAIINTNYATARRMTDWTNQPASFVDLAGGWATNLCDVFVHWHVWFEKYFLISEKLFIICFGLVGLALVLYAFYFLWRNTPRATWLFVLTVTGITGLAIVVPDLVLGGRRSAVNRYLFPSILGIQLAIAYLLASKITVPSSAHRKSWRTVTAIVISLGVLAGATSSWTESWNGKDDFVIAGARIINRATRPLVISDGNLIYALMPLNYRLKPHVKLLLASHPAGLIIPDAFSEVFLFSSSRELHCGR